MKKGNKKQHTSITDKAAVSFNFPVMQSSKILSLQKKFLLKLIDEDIQQQKKFLKAADDKLYIGFHVDDYWYRRKKAQEKKISFAEQCREKILNFT